MNTNEADLMGNMPEFGNGPDDNPDAPTWSDNQEGETNADL